MRLALVTRRYPPLIGGAEKVLSYLAAALADEGAEVTVLTSLTRGLPERTGDLRTGGRLEVLRLATSPIRFVGTWRYMRNLGRWFDKNPVDLAYVSMLKHDAYVAIGAGKRLGFPVVLRPEGAGLTGDIAWQGWGRFGKAIGRRCRRADAVVSISEAVTGELLAAGYDPTRIHAIPNGVPVPREAWRPREGWWGQPRAVFVGRLAPEKGLDTLVEAWAQVVRPERPEARLTLIGEGPERPALQELASALGVAGAIEMPGAVEDPAGSFGAFDLFVLPSREEGMSIALLEAMAAGMPLVASAIPGNQRLVEDGVQGRLAPPGDPKALGQAILDQWADAERAMTMGQAARELVQRDYSIAAMARRHLDLFRTLVPGKSSPIRRVAAVVPGPEGAQENSPGRSPG